MTEKDLVREKAILLRTGRLIAWIIAAAAVALALAALVLCLDILVVAIGGAFR